MTLHRKTRGRRSVLRLSSGGSLQFDRDMLQGCRTVDGLVW